MIYREVKSYGHFFALDRDWMAWLIRAATTAAQKAAYEAKGVA